MAIFRAETKSLSRGKGHNLVAAISYRAGIALTDNNELNPAATSYDYTKKTDVVHSEILMPESLKKQLYDAEIKLDFQSIANLVEQGEMTKRGKMKNSARLGREWVLCGVPELSRAENIALFQKFATEQGEEQGVVSMCFVHDPKAGNDTRSKSSTADATAKDERNIHAHIVLLTRKLELTDTNTLKLGAKSDSELSNDERTRPVIVENLVGTTDPDTGLKIQQGRGLCSNTDWLKNTRKLWADMLNEKLLEKGVQPVSHKSYRELGLDIVPTVHVGNNDYSNDKRTLNERINSRNESAIKSATDSCIDKTSQRIADSVRPIADSVRLSNTAGERAKEREERVRERAKTVENQYEHFFRAADFYSDTTRTINRCSERTRERERIVAESVRNERYFREPAASAIYCYQHNLRIIASRLAWRNVESHQYDARQTQQLNKFYQTLGVQDFKRDVSCEEYVAPQLWADVVKDKLTVSHITDNADIVAILLKPVAERDNYAKTSQNRSDSILNQKGYVCSLELSEATEIALKSTVSTINRRTP